MARQSRAAGRRGKELRTDTTRRLSLHAYTFAASGDIGRFPSAKQLVGYAGLDPKVHASGQAHWSGRITKSGRKDLRCCMRRTVQSSITGTGSGSTHSWSGAAGAPRRRSPSLPLLVAVWYVLAKACADRFADPLDVARAVFGLDDDIGVHNLPNVLTALLLLY